MGSSVGVDVSGRLHELLLWLLFDALLSIEGEVDITGIWREGVDLWATFFSGKVDEGDTSLADVVPSTSETLKAMGRDVQGLCNSWLGRILLGRPEDESQG
jgi:hypothetical protein